MGDDRGLGHPGPRPPLLPLLRERLDLVLLVALGGAAGSLARWGVDGLLHSRSGSVSWPLVVVNTSGSLLLGVLVVVLATRRPGSRRLRPLVGTGVLGGWTTFSAAVLDLQGHLASHRYDVVATTVLVGLLLPVLAAWAGMSLAAAAAAQGGPE